MTNIKTGLDMQSLLVTEILEIYEMYQYTECVHLWTLISLQSFKTFQGKLRNEIAVAIVFCRNIN